MIYYLQALISTLGGYDTWSMYLLYPGLEAPAVTHMHIQYGDML